MWIYLEKQNLFNYNLHNMKYLNKKRHHVIFRNVVKAILKNILNVLIIVKNHRILDCSAFLFDITQ
jgi:hypothetical protein